MVTVPEKLDYQILEGGIGQEYCVFRIRAPKISPTYMVLKRADVELVVDYEAEDEYTDDAAGPPRWAFRLPQAGPIPRIVRFKLLLPPERPLRIGPRVYRLDHLAHVESGYTDKGLVMADGWERLPDPSKESRLDVAENRAAVDWEVRPSKVNVAYKIEWDW